MPCVWGSNVGYYHLVDCGCAQVVQGSKGKLTVPEFGREYPCSSLGDQVNIEHQIFPQEDNNIEGTREGKEPSHGSSSGSMERSEGEADGGAKDITVT